MSCDVVISQPRAEEEICPGEINLPFLQNLRIVERSFDRASPEAPSLLDLISAPTLAELEISGLFLEQSLLNFFKRSPSILDLRAPYLDKGRIIYIHGSIAPSLPFLTSLYLWPCSDGLGNRPPSNDANCFCAHLSRKAMSVLLVHACRISLSWEKLIFRQRRFAYFSRASKKNVATLNIQTWSMVQIIIDDGTQVAVTKQQILDLVCQKKAEGINVDVGYVR